MTSKGGDMASLEDQANRFLAGEDLAFDEADALW
jgi:hypothetical protein